MLVQSYALILGVLSTCIPANTGIARVTQGSSTQLQMTLIVDDDTVGFEPGNNHLSVLVQIRNTSSSDQILPASLWNGRSALRARDFQTGKDITSGSGHCPGDRGPCAWQLLPGHVALLELSLPAGELLVEKPCAWISVEYAIERDLDVEVITPDGHLSGRHAVVAPMTLFCDPKMITRRRPSAGPTDYERKNAVDAAGYVFIRRYGNIVSGPSGPAGHPPIEKESAVGLYACKEIMDAVLAAGVSQWTDDVLSLLVEVTESAGEVDLGHALRRELRTRYPNSSGDVRDSSREAGILQR